MALVLEVVSSQAASMGAGRRFVVGPKGARIGRSDDNDWVLPSDYVSGRHATIRCSNGMYFIEAWGRTPLVLNEHTRLPKGAQELLRDGDVLEIDRFRIAVRIVEDPDAVAALQAQPSPPTPPREKGEPAPRRRRHDVLDLVPPKPDAPKPRHAPQRPQPQPADVLLSHAAPVPPRPASQPPKLDPFTRLPRKRSPSGSFEADHRQEALTRLPGRSKAAVPRSSETRRGRASQRSGKSPGGTDAAIERGLSELLRGAGLDVEQIDAIAPAKLGEVLRVVIEGTLELLAARARLKSAFRLAETRIGADANNPLKFAADAQDALQDLLVKRKARYLDPVAAFREAFKDLVVHELATVVGMQAAYDHMIARFDPARIEARLEQTAGLGNLVGRKRRLWELYCQEYEAATGAPDRGFAQLFAKAFARAYEAQMDSSAATGTPHGSRKR